MSDETRGCQCNECKAGLHSSADLLAENERLRAELEIGDAALLRAIGAQQLRTDLNTMREAMEAHARRADTAEAEVHLLTDANERGLAQLTAARADLAASREQTAAVERERDEYKHDYFTQRVECNGAREQIDRVTGERDSYFFEMRQALAVADAYARERDEHREELRQRNVERTELFTRAEAAEREVTKLRARADKLWNLVEQALDWTSMPWPEHAARVRRNLAAMSSPTTPAGEVEGNRKVTREEAAGEAKKINWPGGIHPYNAVALGHRDSAPASPIEAPGKRCPLCGKPLLGQVSDDETTTSWNCSCGYAAARMRVDAPTIPTSEKGE